MFLIVGAINWLFSDTYARYFPSKTNPNELRFNHFGTYEDFEFWRDLIREFEQLHPNRQIKQEYVVGVGGEYNTKIRQQVLTGNVPDVFLMQLAPFQELAGSFTELDLAIDAEDSVITEQELSPLEPNSVSSFRVNRRLRGLPVSGGSLLIYINEECFRRAEAFRGIAIPRPDENWTMDDFRETARLLTCDLDGDGTPDQFGFWRPRWIYFLPFLWSFGAEIVDDLAKEWLLHGSAAEEALAYFQDLTLTNRVCPTDDEVPQLFQDVGFLTGKVAMCVNGPWFQPFLAKTRLADSYSVAPIPFGPDGRATRVTWDAVVMAKDLPPQRRELAREFVRFIASKNVQDRIARSGRAVPARVDSQELYVEADAERRRPFVEALSYSRLQPQLRRFNEIDRLLNGALNKLADPRSRADANGVIREIENDPVIKQVFSHSRKEGGLLTN